MEVKEPKPFEVNDKAHADLFNDMVKVLLENDHRLIEQFLKHTNDARIQQLIQKSRNVMIHRVIR